MTFLVDGTLGGTFPSWTTATRPASPAVGQMGYNTTTGLFDQYIAAGWTPLGAAAGSVLQVVTTNDSAQRATPNSTMTASGMSVTITPKFSTSKIFVQVTTCGYINTDGSGYYTIYRGSTNLAGSGNQLNILNVVDRYVPICMSYLDSPSTTSSTTYQIYFYKTGTNNVYVNATNSGSSVGAITVMEIAA